MGAASKSYAARDPAACGRARLRVVVAVMRIANIMLSVAVCGKKSEETKPAMSEQADDRARDDDRNEEVEGTPIPDPEEEQGTAADDPQAD
jgi:hypothetical protein